MRLKKRYILNLEGETFPAVVTTDGKNVDLQVADNEDEAMDARRVLGGRAWSLRRHNRQFLVYVTNLGDKGTMAATVGGRPVRMTVCDELRALALAEVDHDKVGGKLVADIPGLVVEIKVSPGQKVKRGEPVIVVEAMKMQNELGAGIDGTVKEIPVEQGQAVNPGDPLVIIEPDSD